MRHIIVCALLALAPSRMALGQAQTEFTSIEDGFRIPFPGQPQVQSTTYTSQYGYTLASRVYSVTSGPQRFSVTVVDYRGIQQQAIAKHCPCPPRDITAIIGEGEWRNDVRGAMVNALNIFFKRGTRLTTITGDTQDFIDGMILQGVNADGSRTSASISMHDNRLYIVEGDAPATGYPPPVAFIQNLSYVDKEGKSIRYRRMYSNGYHGLGEFPVPARVGQRPIGGISQKKGSG